MIPLGSFRIDRVKDIYFGACGIFQLAFQDLCQFLLCTQESLGDVKSRVTDPITMDRFRPNIVCQGAQAFDEVTTIKQSHNTEAVVE